MERRNSPVALYAEVLVKQLYIVAFAAVAPIGKKHAFCEIRI